MTPPPPSAASGARARASQPLRLVSPSSETPAPQPAPHPLTTLATPLLPPRDAAGTRADVWEELDHAAAWVCDHWGADQAPASDAAARGERDARRQALRVLCVAARSADAMGRDGGLALRPGDLPWNVPVPALVAALRQRLVSQTVAAESTGAPAADPTAVLRVVAALDRLGEVARADSTRTIVDQLTGAGALDLLVEVAHDMRSPLASILFLVERLRSGSPAETPLTPSQHRQLALVYGAAFGLASMAGDVMELARGGDRLASGEPAALSLPEVVEGVAAIARPVAEERGLAFDVGAVPREPRVGHAAGVQRVLLNLVTNALKYTPSGSVRLDTATLGGSLVRFTIADTGRGIPPQVLANLFQAFRPRATHDFAFSSAGLGLAICQKLVAAMGGTLAVDSAPDRGTTFRVELPLPPASLI